MKTNFPETTGFSGQFIVGNRKDPLSINAQLMGSFVLKRAYKIMGDSLVPDDAPVELRTQDEVSEDTGLPITFTTFENDMAVYKPKADLVVRGFYSSGEHCDVYVTENGGARDLWFHRNNIPADLTFGDDTTPDLDALENMFGWQQRQIGNRHLNGTITTTPPDPSDEDLSNVTFNYTSFDNLFFNFYRRDFAIGGFPKTEFLPGSLIEIHRGAEIVSFSLGSEQVSAKLFIYDGKSPDKKRYWCAKNVTDVRLDTLIVSPQENTAYVLWRGTWDFESYPTDRYRMLDVKVEELS